MFWNKDHFSPILVEDATALALFNIKQSTRKVGCVTGLQRAVSLTCFCVKINLTEPYSTQESEEDLLEDTKIDSPSTSSLNSDLQHRLEGG